MNWDALGAIAEFFGAVGVIATLIYLSIQVRVNTKATKDEATRSLMLANSEAAMDAAKDADLADIIQRGFYRPGELTPAEQARYNLYFFSYYNQVDYAYERFLEGELDERSWNKIAKEIPAYIGAPGGRHWWASDKVRFSSAFIAYVDDVLSKAGIASDLPTVPSPSQG